MTTSLIILIKLGHSVISFTKSQTFVFSSEHIASYGSLSTAIYFEGTDLNATSDYSTNIIIIVAGTYQIVNEHFLWIFKNSLHQMEKLELCVIADNKE